jgi:hypothetical protein
MSELLPTSCPTYPACSAPVCPLDPRWPSAYQRNGEPVCFYLRVAVKQGAEERYGTDPVFQAVKAARPAVELKFSDLARRLVVAARSGFPGDNLRGGLTAESDVLSQG